RRRSRPPATRRANEPPRRRQPRVAGTRAAVARRRSHPRRARPVVPRGSDERRARARRRTLALLLRPVAHLAEGEGGARTPFREDCRPRQRGHRTPRAVRRALPREEGEGETGTGEADADRAAREGAIEGPRRARPPHRQTTRARLRLPQTAAEWTHRRRGER